MIQLNTSPLASMNQRQRNYPIWAHHHTSLIIFSFSSSPTSNGSVFHSSNLKVWLLLNTQSSSFTISTSHFLERSQSKLHPLPWDTTLIYPTVGEVLPLQRMRWPWPTCDGPITLEHYHIRFTAFLRKGSSRNIYLALFGPESQSGNSTSCCVCLFQLHIQKLGK